MSPGLVAVLLVVGVPLGLIFCTVVARDMDSRGLDGRLYGALTLFVLPLGLALWVYRRATRPRTLEATVQDEPAP